MSKADTHERETLRLPSAPVPLITQVSHLEIGPHVVTAITRRWAEGDERRCRLCASCTAYKGSCTVQVGRLVAGDEAEAFSTLGGDGAGRGLRMVAHHA